MPRTAVAYAGATTVNGAIADPTGTAIVAGAGNGAVIPAAGPGAAAVPELTLLRVANASGSTATVTVLAGAQPLAIASGQGAVSASIPTGTTSWIGPLESGRILQSDGSILVESTQAVTVTAFRVARR